RPRGEQRGERLTIIFLRDREMKKANLALVEEGAVLVLGSDHREFAAVEGNVALDERQRSLADGAEADHHDRPVETCMQLGHGYLQRFTGTMVHHAARAMTSGCAARVFWA